MSNEIGNRIREARVQAGLKQKELAEKIGVSESRVSQYEKGSQNPRIGTLLKIANALEISVQYLCGDQWESINYEARNELDSPFRKYLWSLGYRVVRADKPKPVGKIEMQVQFGYIVISSDNQKTVFTKEQFEAFEKAIADSVNYQIWQQQQNNK